MPLNLRTNKGGVSKGWTKNRIPKLTANLVESDTAEGHMVAHNFE